MVTIMMKCKECGSSKAPVYVYKPGREPDVIDKIICGDCGDIISRVYRKYVHGTKLKRDDEEDDPLPELKPLIKSDSSSSPTIISRSVAQSSQSPSYRLQEV